VIFTYIFEVGKKELYWNTIILMTLGAFLHFGMDKLYQRGIFTFFAWQLWPGCPTDGHICADDVCSFLGLNELWSATSRRPSAGSVYNCHTLKYIDCGTLIAASGKQHISYEYMSIITMSTIHRFTGVYRLKLVSATLSQEHVQELNKSKMIG
jgi:hypothetical protein